MFLTMEAREHGQSREFSRLGRRGYVLKSDEIRVTAAYKANKVADIWNR